MLLKCGQSAQASSFEFADPAFGNLVKGHWIDEVKLLAALALVRDQVRLREDRQVLCHRLTRHPQSLAQLAQCLATPRVQAIQQLAAAGVSQGPKNSLLAQDDDTVLR